MGSLRHRAGDRRPARRRRAAEAVGLLAGFALDHLVGDPRRGHPVAAFGRAAAALERRLYAPARSAGALHTALAVGAPVAAAAAVAALTRRSPAARALAVAVTTWTVLGGRSLRREAAAMADALERADLSAARARLSHLCGRDPATLDAAGLARATVESVAENTSDAVVAPLFWGAVAGLPGLAGYRAANTLDAMVGHRSPRYARFGTPAARLDDALNLLPARLTGLLTVAAAPLGRTGTPPPGPPGLRARPPGDGAAGRDADARRVVRAGGAGRAGEAGRIGEAWRVWRRDRADHPSPNAGQCEAAMAGALGVRLGGRNVYHGRSEVRPLLGDGPRPDAAHIRAAARICGVVGLAAALGAAAARAVPWRVAGGRTAVRSGRRAGGSLR